MAVERLLLETGDFLLLETGDKLLLESSTAGGGFQAAWGRFANALIRSGAMKKNVAGQKVGAQLISAADGSAFTGSVTVYVTGDAGTQAVGSVGSGACTHEGNGYHTYAPAQAETNYDLIAFTFTGSGAIPQTVQVYTSFPQTTDNMDAAAVRAAVGLASANLDTQLAALPTADENADGLLARNVSGGSSSGRTVKQALHFIRNKWVVAAGTLTVYDTDDSTTSWTAAVTGTAGADPVTGVDP